MRNRIFNRRTGQRGSAYVVVLLVLVVLTILGLSLVMVTQTERQIGVSEKTTQRVFSSTETAMALAVSKALVLPDQRSMNLQIIEPRLPGQVLNLRHDLRTSSMLPLLDAPCNLCEVNSGGPYTQNPYKEINHGLRAEAARRGFTSDPDQAGTLGLQQLILNIEFQPWTGQTLVLSDATQDPSDLKYSEEL